MGREGTYTCHNATTRLLHNNNSKSANKSLAKAWHDKAKSTPAFGAARAHTTIMTDTRERSCPPPHPPSIISIIVLSPVLSTCPLHTHGGCGKERRILTCPWGPAKATPIWNYFEIYWLCAGGLLAVNAIGAQLRDPITSGLDR